MKKAILVDLDGTLANIDKRRKELKEHNNFEKFYQEIQYDELNYWCKEIIELFKQKYKIILITGREKTKEVENLTLNWLEKNNIYYDQIYFRNYKDNRKDSIIKKEIFENNIKNKFEILFVVDDRLQVVEMWRKLGLVCLQCDWGDF